MKTTGLNFMEAVSEMMKGKIVYDNVMEYKYKIYNDKLLYFSKFDDEWTEFDDLSDIDALSELLEGKFVVVDEDKDWNLAEQRKAYLNTTNCVGINQTEIKYWSSDVKKCRDLILKDLKSFDNGRILIQEIINKRFGDL